jgi:hypothetical protein
MPTITLLNILFSSILCSLTTFHTHTKQTSSNARCGIITVAFVRIQVFQDATPCLVRSQSPERDVCTSGLLQSNLHWIAHFRSPQQPTPQPPTFLTVLSVYLLMALFCQVFRGPVGSGNILILAVTTAVHTCVFVTWCHNFSAMRWPARPNIGPFFIQNKATLILLLLIITDTHLKSMYSELISCIVSKQQHCSRCLESSAWGFRAKLQPVPMF